MAGGARCSGRKGGSAPLPVPEDACAKALDATLMKPFLLVFSGLWILGDSAELAAAERWVVVGQTDKVVVYIDVQSITVKDGFRQAWEKWEYAQERPAPLTTANRPYRTARYLTSYDCKQRAAGELQAMYFDASGEVIGKVAGKDVSSSLVVPGLLSESALDFVCKAKLRRKP